MKHRITVEGFGYRLRPVRLNDAQFIIDVRLEDAERNKFIHTISRDAKAQEDWINEYFNREGDYYFVIENRITGLPEGLIAFYNEKDGKAEWGRWIVKESSLAATESVDLLYKAAFEQVGLKELYCRTIKDNVDVVSFHTSIGEKTRCEIAKAVNLNGVDYDVVEQYADHDIFYKEIHPALERRAIMIFKRNFRMEVGDFEFHHIGVATKDLNKDFSTFSFLGYTKSSEYFEDPLQGIKGVFLEAKDQPRLELLANLEGSDTVTPMLNSGNKMYHFAYLVSDIEKALQVFINARAIVTQPLKQSTFFGKRICFLMLPNLYVIELIEK